MTDRAGATGKETRTSPCLSLDVQPCLWASPRCLMNTDGVREVFGIHGELNLHVGIELWRGRATGRGVGTFILVTLTNAPSPSAATVVISPCRCCVHGY